MTPTLLRVLGRVRITFVDVGFSAPWASTDADVGPTSLVDFVGDMDGTSFTRCTFEALHQSFARVRHLPTLVSEEFEPFIEQLEGRAEVGTDELPRFESVVQTTHPATVRFDTCVFSRTGRFRSEDGIAVLRGAGVLLSITSSTFVSNSGSVIALSLGVLQIEDCRFLSDPEAEAGIDTFLPGRKVPFQGGGIETGGLWSAIFVGELQNPAIRADRRLGPSPVPLTPISLVATHLQVEGLAALAGMPRSQPITEMNLTLNNVVQGGTLTGEFVVNLRGAGVRGSLVLNGCTLGGYVRAFADNAEPFEVIDAGTTLAIGASFETARLVKRLPLSVEVS